MKNAENQELLERQRQYKEANETIPKNHNKPIHQIAYTKFPPPSVRKAREELMQAYSGTRSRITRKPYVRKAVVSKPKAIVVKKPETIAVKKPELDMFGRAKFVPNREINLLDRRLFAK